MRHFLKGEMTLEQIRQWLDESEDERARFGEARDIIRKMEEQLAMAYEDIDERDAIIDRLGAKLIAANKQIDEFVNMLVDRKIRATGGNTGLSIARATPK